MVSIPFILYFDYGFHRPGRKLKYLTGTFSYKTILVFPGGV